MIGKIQGYSQEDTHKNWNKYYQNWLISTPHWCLDVNLKENINTVDNTVISSKNIVNQLRGVRFDWKDSGHGMYGVIAQELEQVLPELVSDGTEPQDC